MCGCGGGMPKKYNKPLNSRNNMFKQKYVSSSSSSSSYSSSVKKNKKNKKNSKEKYKKVVKKRKNGFWGLL
jgi:hypothetical protein